MNIFHDFFYRYFSYIRVILRSQKSLEKYNALLLLYCQSFETQLYEQRKAISDSLLCLVSCEPMQQLLSYTRRRIIIIFTAWIALARLDTLHTSGVFVLYL